jgi:DNA-binding transcriptional ArsR family regulator
MSRGSSVAPVFAALGDRTRLALLTRLAGGRALSITRLHQGSAKTRQAITKHLHVLQRAGLARGRRRGREQIWELERDRFDIARRFLDRVSENWDAALGRLRRHVEKSQSAQGPAGR